MSCVNPSIALKTSMIRPNLYKCPMRLIYSTDDLQRNQKNGSNSQNGPIVGCILCHIMDRQFRVSFLLDSLQLVVVGLSLSMNCLL